MSQTDETTRTELAGDGADKGPFPGGFPLRTDTDVEVIFVTTATGAEAPKTILTDYTIAISDDFSGFTVTIVTDAATADEVMLFRINAALTHIPDYANFDGSPSATWDNDFDKATQQALTLQEQLDRTIRVSKGQPDADLPISPITLKGNADSYIAVNTAEDGFKFVVDETAATNIGGTGTADQMTKFTAEQTIGDASMTEAEAQDTVDITLEDEVIVSGGIVTHQTGLIYDVTPCDYYIDRTRYSTVAGTATIGTEHATLDRIDTVVVNTSSAIAVVAGTAAANPVEPAIDQSTQIKLANITVTNTAGGGGTGVTVDLMYDENAGASAEWDTSAVAATYTIASTDGTPQSGTKSIKGVSVVANDSFLLTSDGQLTLASFPTFSFYMKVISWPVLSGQGGSLEIRWSDGTTTSAWTKVVRHDYSWFDETDTTTWQKMAFDMAIFGITTSTILTMQLRKRGSATTPSFYLDNFVLENTGQGQQSSGIGGSGTTNRLSKFQDASNITDSSLIDDGSTVASDVPVSFPVGQALSNVAIQPTGDPDTGLNSSAGNALELVTNATAALSIDSSQVVTTAGNATIGGDLTVTGVVLASNGTVSAPSVSFTSDPDSGIYRKGANNVAIAANGVELMAWGTTEIVGNDPGNIMNLRVETDGNANTLFIDGTNNRVGILNGSPTVALDVTGSITASGVITAGGGIFSNHATLAAIYMNNTGAQTDEGVWSFVNGLDSGAADWVFGTRTDALGAGVECIRVSRATGTAVTSVEIPTPDFIVTTGDLTVTAGDLEVTAGTLGVGVAASAIGAHVKGTVTPFTALRLESTATDARVSLNLVNDAVAWSIRVNTNDTLQILDNVGANALEISPTGVAIKMSSLAGSGSRTVVADANGVLSAP